MIAESTLITIAFVVGIILLITIIIGAYIKYINSSSAPDKPQPLKQLEIRDYIREIADLLDRSEMVLLPDLPDHYQSQSFADYVVVGTNAKIFICFTTRNNKFHSLWIDDVCLKDLNLNVLEDNLIFNACTDIFVRHSSGIKKPSVMEKREARIRAVLSNIDKEITND